MAKKRRDALIFSKLLIAIPEFRFDVDVLDLAYQYGLLDPIEYKALMRQRQDARRLRRVYGKTRGVSVVNKIMVFAHELMSVETVNLLRRLNVITPVQGHEMRLAMRAANKLTASIMADEAMIVRIARVLGVAVSREAVDLIRALDQHQIDLIRRQILDRTGLTRLTGDDAEMIRAMILASIERANRARGAISAGQIAKQTVQDLRGAKSLLDAMTILANSVLSTDMIRAMVIAGVLDAGEANFLYRLHDLGWDAWRKGVKSMDYEGWQARALMISQGIITPEMIKFLQAAGLIDRQTARMLYPAATIIRKLARDEVERILDHTRRYRVYPGEPAIKTYARVTHKTDQEILKLIAEAARDAQREAEALMSSKKFSKLTRARQLNLVTAKLHEEMRLLWENVGYMTIYGERKAARAAIDAMDELDKKLWKDYDARRALSQSARAGVDSYISRQENMQDLHGRLYRNWYKNKRQIYREVDKGLLRGQSAAELAKTLEQFINPKAPGGVRSVAMRLARTEMNSAFHGTSIRYTREQPWVNGYKWHLSGSHPTADVCNDYAQKDHDGIGAGVFKKSHVPGKPHPNCLCFITPVVDKFGEFERGLASGKYEAYMKMAVRNGVFDEDSNAGVERTRKVAAAFSARIR